MPVGAIERIKVECLDFTTGTSFHIHLRAPNDQTAVIEIVVHFPYLWVTAFERLGVPIAGQENVKLHSIRGFINAYGWMLWGGLLMLAFLVMLVATVRINPRALARNLGLVVPFAALANLLMMLAVRRWSRWEKKRREEKEHAARSS
jgi:hypothetical protein